MPTAGPDQRDRLWIQGGVLHQCRQSSHGYSEWVPVRDLRGAYPDGPGDDWEVSGTRLRAFHRYDEEGARKRIERFLELSLNPGPGDVRSELLRMAEAVSALRVTMDIWRRGSREANGRLAQMEAGLAAVVERVEAVEKSEAERPAMVMDPAAKPTSAAEDREGGSSSEVWDELENHGEWLSLLRSWIGLVSDGRGLRDVPVLRRIDEVAERVDRIERRVLDRLEPLERLLGPMREDQVEGLKRVYGPRFTDHTKAWTVDQLQIFAERASEGVIGGSSRLSAVAADLSKASMTFLELLRRVERLEAAKPEQQWICGAPDEKREIQSELRMALKALERAMCGRGRS